MICCKPQKYHMMDELPEILMGRTENGARDLVSWFRKQHTSLIYPKSSELGDFIQNIFSIFSTNHSSFSNAEWDRLKLIAYTFIISLSPKPAYIPQLTFNTDYGELFSAILVLSSINIQNPNFAQQYQRIFKDICRFIQGGMNAKHFYSLTRLRYVQKLPTLIRNLLKEDPNKSKKFLNSILATTSQNVTYDLLYFVSQLLHEMKLSFRIEDICKVLGHLIDVCSNSPSTFLQHFFFSWIFWASRANENKQSFFADQIEKITQLFAQTSNLKYHELHRQFQWYLVLYFYGFVSSEDDKKRILMLLCNGIRRVNRLDDISKMKEFTRQFASITFKSYREGRVWALYYMLTSLESSVDVLIKQLDKVSGLVSLTSTQHKPNLKRTLTFTQQGGGFPLLDDELFTVFEDKHKKTVQEAVRYYEKITTICDYVRKHLSSITLFQFQLVSKLGEVLQEEIRNDSSINNSVPLHYLLSIVKQWTVLMINVAHKQTVLKSFNQRELVCYPDMQHHMSIYLSNPSQLLDFSNKFREFFEIIVQLPNTFYSFFTVGMAKMMFSSMKKGILTYQFAKYFTLLPNETQPYNKTFFFNLLSQMMQIASDNTNLFMSPYANGTLLINSWTAFTIRLGLIRTNDKPNPLIELFLKQYQKLFIIAVLFNSKRIANQSIALRTVKMFLQCNKYNTTNTKTENQDQTKQRRKPMRLEEIQPIAKFESLDTVLTIHTTEPNYIDLESLVPFLEASLLSGNYDVITKAVQICLEEFTKDRAKEWIKANNITFFQPFFEAMTIVPPHMALEILKIIPYYTPLYLEMKSPSVTGKTTIIIDNVGFDMSQIISTVISHISSKKESIFSLLNLLRICFDTLLHHLSHDPLHYTDIMRELILLLCHIWSYDFIGKQIKEYSYYITTKFAEAFVHGESNVFLLCLLDTSGSGRSSISRTAIELSKTFLESIKSHQFDNYMLQKTVDALLSFFTPSNRLLAMLNGLSLFVRFFPEYVHISHLRSFLVQTSEVFALDVVFAAVLNRMLKDYLSISSDEIKHQFVSMVFDIISPVSINIRRVLIKRVEKLKIPLPIRSYRELEQPNKPPVLILIHLCLAFCAGINGPFDITPGLAQIVIDQLQTKSDGQYIVEKFSRILTMIKIILKNQHIFEFFAARNDFFPHVINYLCNSFLARFHILHNTAKKCMVLFKTKYPDEFAKYSSDLDEYILYPEKILSFNNTGQHADRIDFYCRLTRALPEKVPHNTVIKFLEAVIEYSNKSETEKMINLPSFTVILKFFSIQEFINQDKVKQLVLSKYNEYTYLYYYINVIIELFEHSEIPYITLTRKYIIQFLCNFPKETIDYITHPSQSSFAFFYLGNIIRHDDSNVFLQAFIDYCGEINDYSSVHPSVFKILEVLSQRDRFIKQPRFVRVIEFHFTSLYKLWVSGYECDLFYTFMTYLVSSLCNLFKVLPDVNKYISTARIFSIQYFLFSDVYSQYVSIISSPNANQSFLTTLLNIILEKFRAISPKTKVLEYVLPHLIKYTKEADYQHIWDVITKDINVKMPNISSILHCIIKIIPKFTPSTSGIATLTDIMKITLTTSDIQLTLYSLKLSLLLAKKSILPDALFESILEQVFTYPKFFDIPYTKYTFPLLKTKIDYLHNLSPKLQDLIAFYLHDKFMNPTELQKMLSPYSSPFITAPILMKYSPVSIIIAVSTKLDSSLHATKTDEERDELVDAFLSAINFCEFTKPPNSELGYLVKVCLKYLKSYINGANLKIADFADHFYRLLIKCDISFNPKKMLSTVLQIIPINFGFVCCAAKLGGETLMREYPELVEKAIHYVENQANIIQTFYITTFIEMLYAFNEFNSKYRVLSIQMFENLISSPKPDMERYLLIAKIAINHRFTKYMEILWGKYDQNTSMSNQLLRFLTKCAEDIAPEQQIEYIKTILSKIGFDKDKNSYFALSVPFLIRSSRVTNTAKYHLIQVLPRILHIEHMCDIEKLIQAIISFSESSPYDVYPYLVQLFIIQATRTCDMYCLQFMEKAISYLPINLVDRTKYLFDNLDTCIWQDKYLPIIASLLTPQSPNWQPIFSLANQLSNIGSYLICACFSKIANEENYQMFLQLLSEIIKLPDKSLYVQILSGLINMFHKLKINIPYSFAQKAIKYTGELHLLEFFVTPESEPSFRFLLPHQANDMIYGIFRSTLSSKDAAAFALTILGNYSAAKYDTDVRRMAQVNEHMMSGTYSLEAILKPLSSIQVKANAAFLGIKEAVKIIKGKHHHEKLAGVLQKIREDTISLYHPYLHRTCYEKERTLTIEVLVKMMEKKYQFVENLTCLNPSFVNLLDAFNRYLKGIKIQRTPEVTNGESIALLSHSMINDFSSVSCITSKGLVGIGQEHVNEYFHVISDRITADTMKPTDWVKFAGFSFNLFCACESAELFSSAYGSYCRIILSKMEIVEFHRHEAASRIITMIRISIESQNKLYIEQIKLNAEIFTKKYSEVWRFWIQQLVELAITPWFYDISKELFLEMSYRSTLYAKKQGNFRIVDSIKNYLPDQVPVQISMMEKCEIFFNELFQNDLMEYDKQERYYQFLTEMSNVENSDDIDIISLRKVRNPQNSAERALEKLTMAEINHLGDFKQLMCRVKQMKNEEIDKLVQEITDSKFSYLDMKSKIRRSVSVINDNLPFMFPIILDVTSHLSILRVHDDISVKSSDMFSIPITTSNPEWQRFVVQESKNQRGYHISVVTMSNILFLMKIIFQNTYATHRRQIQLYPSQIFEIGTHFIIIPIKGRMVTFSNLFQRVMMMTGNEWLEKHTVIGSSGEQKVTQEGEDSIKKFPLDTLKKLMIHSMDETQFLRMRPQLAKALSANIFVRYLFNAPYPPLDKCIGCPTSGTIPILHSDFDHGNLTTNSIRTCSNSRLSPNMKVALGPSLNGECVITIAVLAQALTQNIESMRSYLESLIGDELFEEKRRHTLSAIRERVVALEQKFIELCPPSEKDVTAEQGEEWLQGVEGFIDRASDPTIQPIEAIPWF